MLSKKALSEALSVSGIVIYVIGLVYCASLFSYDLVNSINFWSSGYLFGFCLCGSAEILLILGFCLRYFL